MCCFRPARHPRTIKLPRQRKQLSEASSSRPKQQVKAAGLASWLPQAARAWTVAQTLTGHLLLR
jgi:hypothetical protein